MITSKTVIWPTNKDFPANEFDRSIWHCYQTSALRTVDAKVYKILFFLRITAVGYETLDESLSAEQKTLSAGQQYGSRNHLVKDDLVSLSYHFYTYSTSG